MFKNKYEADNSRFGEVLTQVLSAHGIGVRQFLAEAKVGKTSRPHLHRFIARESSVARRCG